MKKAMKKRVAREVLLFWLILVVNLLTVGFISVYNTIIESKSDSIQSSIREINAQIRSTQIDLKFTSLDYFHMDLTTGSSSTESEQVVKGTVADLPELELLESNLDQFIDILRDDAKLKRIWENIKIVRIEINESHQPELDKIIDEMTSGGKSITEIYLKTNKFKKDNGTMAFRNQDLVDLKTLFEDYVPPSKTPLDKLKENFDTIVSYAPSEPYMLISKFEEFQEYVSYIINIDLDQRHNNKMIDQKKLELESQLIILRSTKDNLLPRFRWDKLWDILMWVSIAWLIIIYPIRFLIWSLIWSVRTMKSKT